MKETCKQRIRERCPAISKMNMFAFLALPRDINAITATGSMRDLPSLVHRVLTNLLKGCTISIGNVSSGHPVSIPFQLARAYNYKHNYKHVRCYAWADLFTSVAREGELKI